MLVVSDVRQQAAMAAAVPETIKEHSRVIFFPYCDGVLNRLVIEHPEIQDTLRAIAKVDNPKLDELVSVLGVLVLACSQYPNGCPIDELIRYANSYFPAQIRALDAVDGKVEFTREDFLRTLADIEDLTYDFKRGFFCWSGLGTSGVLGFDCSSDQFKQFQESVVRQQPKTFDDFEVLLP